MVVPDWDVLLIVRVNFEQISDIVCLESNTFAVNYFCEQWSISQRLATMALKGMAFGMMRGNRGVQNDKRGALFEQLQ